MGERRNRRVFTAKQKLEIVLEAIRSGNVSEVCRRNDIQSTVFYRWRDQFLEGGMKALGGQGDPDDAAELRKKVAQLERALGRKTYELEVAGKAWRELE